MIKNIIIIKINYNWLMNIQKNVIFNYIHHKINKTKYLHKIINKIGKITALMMTMRMKMGYTSTFTTLHITKIPQILT